MAFRCYQKDCSKYKEFMRIRKNSFLENYTIRLAKILVKCYKWFTGKSQSKVSGEYNISKITVQHIYRALRLLTVEFFKKNQEVLGEFGKICQIDESLFKHKQNYNVGRCSEKHE